MTEELEYVVTLYPEPVLRREALPVEAFDADLKAIVGAMLRRMYASDGVGLAGPQVSLRRRILVVNAEGTPDPEHELVLINPRIVEKTGAMSLYEEGCLSFPGIFAEVERPETCRVEAQDLEGNPIEATYEGFLSRVVQHEYDHLEGVLLVDRMSPADKLRHKAALEDLIADYKRHRKAVSAGAKKSRA